jgi:signal recognition particle subunit SEC65
MRTCLVFIRSVFRQAGEAAIADELYRTVQSAASTLGLDCQRVDPHEYPLLSDRLYPLIQAADMMVVDLASQSMDYLYALGVRHTLTDKPTITLEPDCPIPFDVDIRRGRVPVPDDFATDLWARYRLKEHLVAEMKAALEYTYETSYSPVRSALEEVPRVFLSYTRSDAESVAAVDQWLRDRAVRVDIDARDFIAGRDLRDEIVKAIERARKVVFFHSARSSGRYYPKLERRLAEEMEERADEAQAGHAVLIMFRLDDTPLPLGSSHRLAINAFEMGFEEACLELYRNILEKSGQPRTVNLANYKVKPPWDKTYKRYKFD